MKDNRCCLVGAGKIYMAEYEAYKNRLVPLTFVGNSKDFTINAETSKISVPSYTGRVAATDCSKIVIDEITVNFTTLCHNLVNIARALNAGDPVEEVAGAVTHLDVAYPCGAIPVPHVFDLTLPITVTSADGLVTYVAGVDYEITENGTIEILEATTIPAPTIVLGVAQPNILVSATSVDSKRIELFTQIGKDYVIYFDGVNRMNDNESTKGSLYKVTLSPAEYTIIGDGSDAAELAFEGTALEDKTISTSGGLLSQYGSIVANTNF